jgi:DNA invertase Pin-like site-specific DNA recombinase
MARSVLDLAKIADQLRRKGVHFKVLDQGLDTSTSEGKLMAHLLGAFAEFENDIRRERQLEGIAAALNRGVRFGRKPALTEKQLVAVRRLKQEEGFSAEQLAEKFGVGRATIYRALQWTRGADE